MPSDTRAALVERMESAVDEAFRTLDALPRTWDSPMTAILVRAAIVNELKESLQPLLSAPEERGEGERTNTLTTRLRAMTAVADKLLRGVQATTGAIQLADEGALREQVRAAHRVLASPPAPAQEEEETVGFTVAVEGDAPVVYDTPERAVAEAVRRVYLPDEHHADQVRLLKLGEIADWGHGFYGVAIYPPARWPSSPPAPAQEPKHHGDQQPISGGADNENFSNDAGLRGGDQPAPDNDHPPITVSSRGVSSVRPADILASRAGQEQIRAAAAMMDAQEPEEELRSCNADGCGWIGLRSECRRLGDIGPLCPDCGETTEVEPSAPPVAQGAEERTFDTSYASGILDRLDRFTADQRAHVFHALETRWCWDWEEERRACPVCGGRGNVALGFYGDRISGNSTSAVNLETCRTCNGTTVYPPARPVAGSELVVRALSHDPGPEEWGALTINLLCNWSTESMVRLRDFLANRTPVAGSEEPTCGVCGGRQTEIRPRHPGESRRVVCPTCLADRLAHIHEQSSPTYGVAYAARTGEEVRDV